MKRDLLGWIAERRLLVSDGAMGTMLQSAGLAGGGCPELWNSERPETVQSIHATYAEAGAELLETNSFGGSPRKLAAYGLESRCREINRAAASLARQAAGDRCLVLGSIGPTGELLEPLGKLTEAMALEGFSQQAEALAEGGVDGFCVETMTDLTEAALAVRAAAATGLPVVACMTFEATPRGFYTIMGVTLDRAAAGLEQAGAKVVGANCGTGPAPMVAVLIGLRKATERPLIVQPNAGMPEFQDGQIRYPESPGGMASYIAAMAEAGAAVVGGCCGSTPEHIRVMAGEIRRLRSESKLTADS